MRISLFGLILISAASADDHAEIRHHHPSPIHRHHLHVLSDAATFSPSLSLGFDSRYASEGRDVLDGDSLMTAAFEASFEDVVVGLWYGESPDDSYDELHLSLEYGFEMGPLEASVGYTHLRFPDDGAIDHEVFASLLIDDLPGGLEAGLDATYSFDARGTFWELSLTRPIEVSESLSLEPGILLAFNDGYIPAGHSGANHVAASLVAIYELAEQVELSAYLSYNLAINSDPVAFADDALLKDFGVFGTSVTLSF